MTQASTDGRRRTYYGVPIGILMLDTKFERFNGDIGNAQTWPFPVQYKIVQGAVPNKVVDTLNNRDLFQRFADAADELIAAGVDGITTNRPDVMVASISQAGYDSDMGQCSQSKGAR